MVLPHEIVPALLETKQRVDDLTAEDDAWRVKWEARTPETGFAILQERPANYDARRRELLGEITHLSVLRDACSYRRGVSNFAECCRPAFDLNYEEVQTRLAEWLLDVVVNGEDMLFDCQRLLLAWCAQLLVVSNSSGHHNALYPDDFRDAARSIYAYATGPEVAMDHSHLTGRNGYNARLMLALTSFPFLEGMVRRRQAAYLTPDGNVLQDFDVPTRTGQTRRYKVGKQCSSVRDALHLLELSKPQSDIAQRLVGLRANVARQGISAKQTLALSSGQPGADLYDLIQVHRNSNMHGGSHIVHVGLAALLLATLIGLAEIQQDFDACRDFGLMVVRQHAPLKPSGQWTHITFYPVDFPSAYEGRSVHCWLQWQRAAAGTATTDSEGADRAEGLEGEA